MRGLPSLRTLDEDAAGVPRVRLKTRGQTPIFLFFS